MHWTDCDMCEDKAYTEDNPFVEVRTPRPSDPTEMTCVMAGHFACMPGTADKPEASNYGGVAMPAQWQEWIEGPGAEAGFLWLG